MNRACPSIEVLQSFLEGDLEDTDNAAVQSHIADCEDCQGQLDQLTTGPRAELTQLPAGTFQGSDVVMQALLQQLRSTPLSGLDSQQVSAIADTEEEDDVQFPGPPMADAPLGVLGKYRIQEKIGFGTSGILYRALDSELDRTVAIKILRSELAACKRYRARMVREARAAAKLNHEHVVTVYQIGNETAFPPFLVMELIEGESLRGQLQRQPIPAFRETAKLVRQVALGLSYAHQNGLVHRDIKPANIMLDHENARTKITDFGLARRGNDEERVTHSGALAGTPAYMSPEQITNPDEVDARGDVYSLGVVLYEMLVGRLPFQGDVLPTLVQVLDEIPPKPTEVNPNVPQPLETICLKSIAKAREDRYQSATELAADLGRYLANERIKTRAPKAATPRRNAASSIIQFIGAFAALAAIVLVGFLIVRHFDDNDSLAGNNNANTQPGEIGGDVIIDEAYTAHELLISENPTLDVLPIDIARQTVSDLSAELSEHRSSSEPPGRTVIAKRLTLAILHYNLADLESALTEFKNCVADIEAWEDSDLIDFRRTMITKCQLAMARIHVELKQGKAAKQLLQALLDGELGADKVNSIANRHLRATALGTLAQQTRRENETALADQYFAQTLSMLNDVCAQAPQHLAANYDCIALELEQGNWHWQQGNHEQANSYFESLYESADFIFQEFFDEEAVTPDDTELLEIWSPHFLGDFPADGHLVHLLMHSVIHRLEFALEQGDKHLARQLWKRLDEDGRILFGSYMHSPSAIACAEFLKEVPQQFPEIAKNQKACDVIKSLCEIAEFNRQLYANETNGDPLSD